MTGVFLELVRLGIENASPQKVILPENCDWESLIALAEEQGLDAVVLDGLNRLSSTSLEEYGMKELFYIFNAICIEDLGFEPALFPKAEINRELKGKVLQEILAPAIPNVMPEQWLKRVVWKIHRWKANEWKHQLCYKESMWSAFLSGVWNHLLKPASI